MKKILKRTLATVLTAVMLLTAVPVSGFTGMHLPKWLNFDWLHTEVSAEENQLPDYSGLTERQYMSKVLLNYDYVGTANGYGTSEMTIPGEQFKFYMSPPDVSPGRILCNELENSSSFMGSVAAWKVLTFDPSEAYEDLLDEEDYYMAILTNIINVQMNDSEFLNAMNCSFNKTVISLSKGAASFMKELKSVDCNLTDLKNMKISDFSDEEMSEIYGYILNLRDSKDLYDKIGKDIGYVKNAVKTCTTIYDIVKTVSSYSQFANVCDSVENVLHEIYLNCPSDNTTMKAAAKKVYELCSEQMTQSMLAKMEIGDSIINLTFTKIVGELWKYSLTALGSLGVGFKLGQTIGKTISNFCFSTDKTIEQYYTLAALVKFEDVMITTVNSLAAAYKSYQSEANADNFMKSVELLFSTYELGCDYSTEFSSIVNTKGLINTIESYFGQNESHTQFCESVSFIKEIIGRTKVSLVNLSGFRWYYEEDAPSAYIAYFETSETTAPYSKTVTPIYVSYAMSSPNTGSLLEYRVESDGTVTVIGCLSSSCGKVDIPKEYGGKAIRTIASSAFDKCTGITEITTPSTLRTISNSAFFNCSNLTKVTLNDGLKTIGTQAFYGTAIENVSIPKTVTSMNTYNSTDSSCFYGANSLKTVVFEYGMLTIPRYSLYGCSSVTSVYIPNGITTIASYAFSGCTGLTQITFPESLVTISSAAFNGCMNISTAYAVKNSIGYNYAIDK